MKQRAKRDRGASQDFSSLDLGSLDREALRELLVKAAEIYRTQPVDDVQYRAFVGKIEARMRDLDADEEINRFAETLQDVRAKKVP